MYVFLFLKMFQNFLKILVPYQQTELLLIQHEVDHE